MPPGTPISKTWLESTLKIVGSPFAERFLFAGASAAEAEMQHEARDIIQQRKAWKAFHSQEGSKQDFVQGSHLYHNGTMADYAHTRRYLRKLLDSSCTPHPSATEVSPQWSHSHLARRAASEKLSAIFQTLKFLGTRYQTLGIAVPARAPRMACGRCKVSDLLSNIRTGFGDSRRRFAILITEI